MRGLICALAVTVPMQAQACDEVLLACSTGASRQVTVCLSGDSVTYSYGKRGKAAELDLTVPLSDSPYTPWNGIGRYMSDSITFHNAGYAYEVWQSVDKMSPDKSPAYGVNVLQDEDVLKTLACNPGAQAQPFDRLYEATEAQGLCWSFDNRGWQETCP